MIIECIDVFFTYFHMINSCKENQFTNDEIIKEKHFRFEYKKR